MRILLCNCPAEGEVAERIARALVEERLAACVNLVPGVRSIYRWEGRVVDDREVTLLVKTSEARVDDVRRRILALHPYAVPEVLALPVDVHGSHPDYVDWVQRESSDPADAPPDEAGHAVVMLRGLALGPRGARCTVQLSVARAGAALRVIRWSLL